MKHNFEKRTSRALGNVLFSLLSSVAVIAHCWAHRTETQNATRLPSPNLLANGNFEEGNVGFTSDYHFTTEATTAPGQEGQYAITSNPQQINELGASFGDHTSGKGRMLIVNGSTDTKGPVVWRQSVPVKPRTIYRFSFWVASWGRIGDSKDATNPAQLAVNINGERLTIAPTISAPAVVGQWQLVSCLWLSGSSTKAELTILDRNSEFLGNDFTLDDLAFQDRDDPQYSDALPSTQHRD